MKLRSRMGLLDLDLHSSSLNAENGFGKGPALMIQQGHSLSRRTAKWQDRNSLGH